MVIVLLVIIALLIHGLRKADELNVELVEALYKIRNLRHDMHYADENTSKMMEIIDEVLP